MPSSNPTYTSDRDSFAISLYFCLRGGGSYFLVDRPGPIRKRKPSELDFGHKHVGQFIVFMDFPVRFIPFKLIKHNTILYNTLQYNTIHYNTILYNTTQLFEVWVIYDAAGFCASEHIDIEELLCMSGCNSLGGVLVLLLFHICQFQTTFMLGLVQVLIPFCITTYSL
jgi:hypothetical protein